MSADTLNENPLVSENVNTKPAPKCTAYRITVTTAGTVLLIAAALKAWQISTDLSHPAPNWQIAQITIEWTLGLWLCSGLFAHAARWVAVCCFLAFSGVSAWAAWHGQSSCGCFGDVTVHPLATLSLDLVLAASLIVFRPRPALRTRALLSRHITWGTLTVVTVCAGVWMLLAHGHMATGQLTGDVLVKPLPSFEQGVVESAFTHPMIVSSSVADLGYIRPDSVHAIRYVLSNPTDSAVEIRDVQADCRCTNIYRQPTLIPARGSAALDVLFHAPKGTLNYTKSLTVKTASPQMSSILLQVTARIDLPLKIEPTELNLGIVQAGESAQGTFEVINEGTEPIRLLYSTSSEVGCYVPVPRESVPPRGKLILTAMLSSAKKEKGAYSIPLRLATASPSQSSLELAIKYQVDSIK